MTMRVHEIHPMLVHFPLALFPTAVAADAIGAATDNKALMDTGRMLMPLAVASMALTGVAGFAAQDAVHAEGEAHDMLTTHRNLNVGLLAVAAGLAVLRAGQRRPGPGYLLAGLAGAAAITYSGYLGGKMVYRHGVGVGAADGFDPEKSSRIHRDNLGQVTRTAAADTAHGLAHAVHEAREGELLPELQGGSGQH